MKKIKIIETAFRDAHQSLLNDIRNREYVSLRSHMNRCSCSGSNIIYSESISYIRKICRI